MGMYDELKIHKIHLPKVLENYESGWQTKSLDSCLSLITISKDGQLYETGSELITEKPDKKKALNYTGEVRFYTSIDKKWTEFVAFFENGQMFKIIQTAPK